MAIISPVEMAYLDWLVSSVEAEQKSILESRNYYNGVQADFLTALVRDFLDLHEDNPFTLNVCETIVTAVANILTVASFDTNEKPDKDGVKEQSAWAARVWEKNKMDSLQDVVHEFALADRETFVIVEWDPEMQLPRLVHNQRFIDVGITSDGTNGDGMGVWMVYENDDIYQKPMYAVKQWVETTWVAGGIPQTVTRRTVYYADRIERFIYDGGGWHPFEDETVQAVQPNIGKDGKPLGIPVIHFKNKGYRAEHWKAIPMQDAINKTLVDILAGNDLTAFKSFFAFGFMPTTDGKPMKEDKSNAMSIGPGVINGAANAGPDARLQEIEGASMNALMEDLIKLVTLTAQITDTPVSRFVITAQIASEETIEAQNDALDKKAEDRRGLLGDAWSQVMSIARKITNLNTSEALDEEVEFSTTWRHDRTLKELGQKREVLGIPQEQLWQEAGYTPEQIAVMKTMQEYRLQLEKLLWEGANAASLNGIPLEVYLKRSGLPEAEIKFIQDGIANQSNVPATDL